MRRLPLIPRVLKAFGKSVVAVAHLSLDNVAHPRSRFAHSSFHNLVFYCTKLPHTRTYIISFQVHCQYDEREVE